MARASDAVAGVTLAVFGLLLLVLWRNGTLRRLVTPAAEGYSDIANSGAAPRLTAVDAMPNAGGGPHTTTRGTVTNGFTPTGPVVGSAPLYSRFVEVPTQPAGKDLTGIVALIPDSYEDRILTGAGRFVPDWAIGTVNDFSLGGVRYLRAGGATVPSSGPPTVVGGGGSQRLH